LGTYKRRRIKRQYAQWRKRKHGTPRQIGKPFPLIPRRPKYNLPKNLRQVTIRRTVSLISRAQGIEKAEEVREREINDSHVRIKVRTYKWSHDGPFPKEDYEPVIYFYNKLENKPKHAISFSHYGYAYHKNIRPWNGDEYSPRFPNEFHTPILLAEKVEIKDGSLSKGAYACAKAALYLREQKIIEPTMANVKKGLPPSSAEVAREVNKISQNLEEYWDELERL